MTRHLTRLSMLLCLLAVAAPSLAVTTLPGPGRPASADDSTLAYGFTLPNGLEVRVRHVPGACATSMTLAYRAGTAYVPSDVPSLAPLLAEVQFTSPAGDIPERARQEMDSIRPMGWTVATSEQLALLTEVAAPASFPGVVHQVATRMRGVQPTRESIAHAAAQVRRDLGERWFGSPDKSMHYRVGAVAAGLSDEAIVRRAGAKELDTLSVATVEAWLGRLYGPANAVLAFAGDVSNLDLRKLVEHEFGDIPGGVAVGEQPSAKLSHATRRVRMPGLKQPAVAMGILAPPIEDPTAPEFFLATQLLTGWWNQMAVEGGEAAAAAHYSLFDDPGMARYYFILAPDSTGAVPDAAVSERWASAVDSYARSNVQRRDIDRLRSLTDWMLGGPVHASLRVTARQRPAPLTLLSISTAGRARWKGDAFWEQFRARFESSTSGHTRLVPWLLRRDHQVDLIATPR